MTLVDHIFIFGAKYLFILAVILATVWFFRLPRKEKKSVFIFGLIALPAIFIVSRIASVLYFDPRPFVVGYYKPLIPHIPDNGFPSDHVLFVSAIASVIFPFSRKVSACVWAIAIFVGISRVYVGVHHTVDILGAAAISIVVSAIIFFFFNKKIEHRSSEAQQ